MAQQHFWITGFEHDFIDGKADGVELQIQTTQGRFTLWIQTQDNGKLLVEGGNGEQMLEVEKDG